jgi:microcystin-dependent protein
MISSPIIAEENLIVLMPRSVINAHTTGITVQNTTAPVLVGSTKATASAQNVTVNATASSASISVSEESRGGGQPHQNMQPYLVMNYIIKY